MCSAGNGGAMTSGLVCVVDDDSNMRSAVGRLLRSDNREVETYSSANEFLEHSLPVGPACIVLDLQMPGMSGLTLQRLLFHCRETLPIVFISGHADIQTSVQAMKEGAVDFLTKPFDENQLLHAVGTSLNRAEEAHNRKCILERDRTVFDSLTPREREVCLRVAEGMLNKQIGCEFGTTEKTIKVQRGRAMQKLGAQSVADLVRLVERLRSSGYLMAYLNLSQN